MDYSRYTASELAEAMASIDRERFPINYRNLREAMENIQSSSVQVVDAPQQKAEENSIYAGFWRRFAAYWIDVAIWLPLGLLVSWAASSTRYFYAYWLVPGSVIGLWYYIYLVRRYGGTPGKLIMGLEVLKLDETRVGYREAILRHIIQFIVGTLSATAMAIGAISIDESVYSSLSFLERGQQMGAGAPSWNSAVNVLMQLWIWSEFLVLLTNKKRRALHDFMAGTVVVRRGAQQIAPADVGLVASLLARRG